MCHVCSSFFRNYFQISKQLFPAFCFLKRVFDIRCHGYLCDRPIWDDNQWRISQPLPSGTWTKGVTWNMKDGTKAAANVVPQLWSTVCAVIGTEVLLYPIASDIISSATYQITVQTLPVGAVKSIGTSPVKLIIFRLLFYFSQFVFNLRFLFLNIHFWLNSLTEWMPCRHSAPPAHLNIRLCPHRGCSNISLVDLLNSSRAFHRLVYRSWDRLVVMFGSFGTGADSEMSIYDRVVVSKVRWNWDSLECWTSSVKIYTNKLTVNPSSPVSDLCVYE